MSYKITPTLVVGVSQTIPLTPAGNVEHIEVWNSTPYDLDYFGLGASSQEIIPAGIGKQFFAKDNNVGQVTLLAVNNYGVPGTGIVNIIVYNKGDIYDTSKRFPVAIPTQIISVPYLINTGNLAGFEIIKSIVSGDTFQAVQLTNDAIFILGDTLHPGTITVTDGVGDSVVISGPNGSVKASTQGFIGNIVKTITGNDLSLQVETGHRIANSINSVVVTQQDVNGYVLVATTSKYKMLVGSISRIQILATLAITNVLTQYNHTLGVTPDIVLVQALGGVTGRTISVNGRSSTQVQLIGSGSFNVDVTLIAF